MIKFVISDKTDSDLHEIPISDAMTKNLIMANKNNIITYCAKTMIERTHEHNIRKPTTRYRCMENY